MEINKEQKTSPSKYTFNFHWHIRKKGTREYCFYQKYFIVIMVLISLLKRYSLTKSKNMIYVHLCTILFVLKCFLFINSERN